MAVKIRLARRGRKRKPIYNIVVADERSPRDGRFIEKLGTFNPNVHPPQVSLNVDRSMHWIMVGAQPTDTARSILSKQGVMLKKHLQVGVNKGAITQEQADERFEAWKTSKLTKEEAEAQARAKAKADEQAALEAQVREAREKERAEEEARLKAEADAAAAAEAAAQAEVEAAATAEAEAPAEGEEKKEEGSAE